MAKGIELTLYGVVNTLTIRFRTIGTAFRMVPTKTLLRPACWVAVFVYAVYLFIYHPQVARLLSLQKTLEHTQNYAGILDKYGQLDDLYHEYLPRFLQVRQQDKELWLLNQTLSVLQQAGIVPDSVSSVRENDLEDFVNLSLTVRATLSYSQMGYLVSLFENRPIWISVSSLQMKKNAPGSLGVVLQISTMVPKKG